MSSRSRNLGQIVLGLNRTQQNLSMLINRILDPMGLNMSRLTVLTHFSNRPNQSQTVSSLVTAVNMNQPSVTKIVRHLIQAGWLLTESDPSDARKKSLKITPQGLGVIINAYGKLTPVIDEAFTSMSDEEAGQFNHLLGRLNNS
jgi:DNA-binding MarR family transcriptional regulator